MRDGTDLIVDHPYYCTEGNYFQNGHHHRFKSWASFIEEWGNADEDMNLLYRWDILRNEEDDELRLKCFYMHQRKARCSSVGVDITNADLPAIREWLGGKWERMRRIWAPLSGIGPAQDHAAALDRAHEASGVVTGAPFDEPQNGVKGVE